MTATLSLLHHGARPVLTSSNVAASPPVTCTSAILPICSALCQEGRWRWQGEPPCVSVSIYVPLILFGSLMRRKGSTESAHISREQYTHAWRRQLRSRSSTLTHLPGHRFCKSGRHQCSRQNRLSPRCVDTLSLDDWQQGYVSKSPFPTNYFYLYNVLYIQGP